MNETRVMLRRNLADRHCCIASVGDDVTAAVTLTFSYERLGGVLDVAVASVPLQKVPAVLEALETETSLLELSEASRLSIVVTPQGTSHINGTIVDSSGNVQQYTTTASKAQIDELKLLLKSALTRAYASAASGVSAPAFGL